MLYQYPTQQQRLIIPDVLLHATTAKGVELISEFGIQERGYNFLRKQNPPMSLDFGEGFYCTYNNQLCNQQVSLLAQTRAKSYNSKPVV